MSKWFRPEARFNDARGKYQKRSICLWTFVATLSWSEIWCSNLTLSKTVIDLQGVLSKQRHWTRGEESKNYGAGDVQTLDPSKILSSVGFTKRLPTDPRASFRVHGIWFWIDLPVLFEGSGSLGWGGYAALYLFWNNAPVEASFTSTSPQRCR